MLACSSPSLSVPNLVCQNQANADREREKKGDEAPGKGETEFHHSFIPLLSITLLPSPPSPVLVSASPARGEKAAPCQFRRLPASVRAREPLRALTVIRGTETNTVCVFGDRAQSVSANTELVMRATIPLLPQKQFNQARRA